MGFNDEELTTDFDSSVDEITDEKSEDIDQEVAPVPLEKKRRGITEVLVGLVRRA